MLSNKKKNYYRKNKKTVKKKLCKITKRIINGGGNPNRRGSPPTPRRPAPSPPTPHTRTVEGLPTSSTNGGQSRTAPLRKAPPPNIKRLSSSSFNSSSSNKYPPKLSKTEKIQTLMEQLALHKNILEEHQKQNPNLSPEHYSHKGITNITNMINELKSKKQNGQTHAITKDRFLGIQHAFKDLQEEHAKLKAQNLGQQTTSRKEFTLEEQHNIKSKIQILNNNARTKQKTESFTDYEGVKLLSPNIDINKMGEMLKNHAVSLYIEEMRKKEGGNPNFSKENIDFNDKNTKKQLDAMLETAYKSYAEEIDKNAKSLAGDQYETGKTMAGYIDKMAGQLAGADLNTRLAIMEQYKKLKDANFNEGSVKYFIDLLTSNSGQSEEGKTKLNSYINQLNGLTLEQKQTILKTGFILQDQSFMMSSKENARRSYFPEQNFNPARNALEATQRRLEEGRKPYMEKRSDWIREIIKLHGRTGNSKKRMEELLKKLKAANSTFGLTNTNEAINKARNLRVSSPTAMKSPNNRGLIPIEKARAQALPNTLFQPINGPQIVFGGPLKATLKAKLEATTNV